ncbi:MAG: hypothetical protein ACRC7S_18360 [Cetobacterium sp.]
MTLWFCKHRKSFSINWYREWNKPHFFVNTNGAIKGIDSCYDLNIAFYKLHISYTNWSYNNGGK